MKKIIKSIALFLATPIFLATNCQDKKAAPCPPDTICTEIFAMVTLQVVDAGGETVRLDEFHTVRVSNNETIKPEQSMESGYYIVLDDSYRKNLQNTADNFRFIGMKDGRKVVDELYTIGGDCCHINKIKGKDQITVNP